jgi:hypothetical protein
MTQYRNITIGDDGKVRGEHNRYGSWMGFTARLDLLWIEEALGCGQRAHRSIWELQDGLPGQGYDWSGIRDSSPRAIAEMFARAQDILPGFMKTLEAARVAPAPEGDTDGREEGND